MDRYSYTAYSTCLPAHIFKRCQWQLRRLDFIMRANNVENGGAHRQAIGTCHVLVSDLLDGSLHQGGTVKLRIGLFLCSTWIVALVLGAFHIWMALRTGSEK